MAKDDAVILIHAGFGTPRAFTLQGRVLEDKGIRKADAKRGRLRNFVDSVKALETDEIEDVKVRVKIRNHPFEAQAKTDDDGVWRVAGTSLAQPLPVGKVPITVELLDRDDYEAPVARGVVHILADEPGVVVVSDFDDTVVDSRVTEKGKLVMRTLTRNAAQLEPIAGVSVAYRNAKDAGARAFFYVSGSPQNLHERIVEFLELRDIPLGPILLKNVGEDSIFSQEAYKEERISSVLEAFPKLRFVLIGDSGEMDPEIYRAIRAKHPNRVVGIIIRRVPGADNTDARFDGMTTLSEYAGTPDVVAKMVRAAAR